MTIFGTRPEIIRLSRTIPLLDEFADHQLVHTGQNYAPELSDVFFSELKVRQPDVHFGIHAARFSEQVAKIIEAADDLLERVRPDRVLILGDTNSGLAAIVAARRRIPVYHLEAGNRCFDDRVPEEVNRRLIDHSSSVLLPYTHRSKDNLIREGFERDRIMIVGNPIFEVIEHSSPGIAASDVINRLKLTPRAYVLVTMHRAENVDDPARLARLIEGLAKVADETELPLVWPIHPRTADRLEQQDLTRAANRLLTLAPLGFFDFVRLERDAACVITDSGTVQEECAIFRVPNVTIRDVTERPETVEAGSNMIAGSEPSDIARAVGLVRALPTDWQVPNEYTVPRVSAAIAKIVLGYASPRRLGN
jgi:UDP-N-acetylglucosamine 2-epimerase (non-hydrolysing)